MASEHSDSQETNSTSLVEDSLTITFENINYSVRPHVFTKERKTILQDVCGTFNAGELTVIMGQSGAGKSTLMDILAGYTKPTTGSILINGRMRNEKSFRRRSCYILQDDKVQGMLTIQESINIAADLKLGNHISKEQKKQRVEEIITSLGLSKDRHTKAADLSGGQRKRLAIGLELVSDPPVMFLDEPTSGLDSSISKQIVYILHFLARQGRTVVVTMHQPSAILLRMVDKLYAIVGGRCAYVGSEIQLRPYLEEINLMCPPYHNAVDFLIEESTKNADKLVEQSKNGRNTRWSTNMPLRHDSNRNEIEQYNPGEEVCLTILPAPTEDPTSKILLALKSTYATSHWQQFTILTRRSLLTTWRERSFLFTFTGIHCAMAVFVGALFWDIGEKAEHAMIIFNLLNYCLLFLMFTAFSSVSIRFPEQIPVIRREHFNRWYTAGAYYMSTLASILPVQTVCTISFTSITYWLTGQPLQLVRFVSFLSILLIVSYVALCKGLLIGSLFNVKNGVIFGPFFIMPFVAFSGFFIRLSDAPDFANWLFQISFLKHGLAGIMLAIFGMNREKLTCSEIYCHYSKPLKIIQDFSSENDSFQIIVPILFGISTIFALSAYVILKIRLKRKW